jgi:hypothetical protein
VRACIAGIRRNHSMSDRPDKPPAGTVEPESWEKPPVSEGLRMVSEQGLNSRIGRFR